MTAVDETPVDNESRLQSSVRCHVGDWLKTPTGHHFLEHGTDPQLALPDYIRETIPGSPEEVLLRKEGDEVIVSRPDGSFLCSVFVE